MSKGVRGSRGTKKKFLWKRNLKKGVLLWNALDINIFLFLLFIFLLILYLYLYLFFFLVTMKRHMTLQSYDMSHDVTL